MRINKFIICSARVIYLNIFLKPRKYCNFGRKKFSTSRGTSFQRKRLIRGYSFVAVATKLRKIKDSFRRWLETANLREQFAQREESTRRGAVYAGQTCVHRAEAFSVLDDRLLQRGEPRPRVAE